MIGTVGSQGTGTLAVGSTGSFGGSLDTSSLAPGTYYVAAVADAGNVLAETDEGDNTTNWIEITIDPQLVDYALDTVEVLPSSDFNLNPDPGTGIYAATIDLSHSVSNDGNTGPTEFTIETYFSRDAVLSADDILVGADMVSVGLGQTVDAQAQYELGEGFPNGDWYVISVISPTSGLPDPLDDETDNVAITTTPITLTGGFTTGTDGDDVFQGQPIFQVYAGGLGDDTLLAATNDDIFDGGEGTDTADYSGLDTGISAFSDPGGPVPGIVIEAYDPSAPFDPDAGTGLLQDVERLIGTDQDDQIFIADGNVTYIDAGAGNDIVFGSFGNDEILGGAGNDTIAGWFGDDTLSGGEGADTFLFEREPDGVGGTFGHGNDTVLDFNPLEDLMLIEFDAWVETVDPLSLVQSVDGGLLVQVADDSSVFLAGLTEGDLNTTNLFAVPEDTAQMVGL